MQQQSAPSRRNGEMRCEETHQKKEKKKREKNNRERGKDALDLTTDDTPRSPAEPSIIHLFGAGERVRADAQKRRLWQPEPTMAFAITRHRFEAATFRLKNL